MSSLVIGAKPNLLYQDLPSQGKYADCPLCQNAFESTTRVHQLACGHFFCISCLTPQLIRAQATQPSEIACPSNLGCTTPVQFNWDRIKPIQSHFDHCETETAEDLNSILLQEEGFDSTLTEEYLDFFSTRYPPPPVSSQDALRKKIKIVALFFGVGGLALITAYANSRRGYI